MKKRVKIGISKKAVRKIRRQAILEQIIKQSETQKADNIQKMDTKNHESILIKLLEKQNFNKEKKRSLRRSKANITYQSKPGKLNYHSQFPYFQLEEQQKINIAELYSYMGSGVVNYSVNVSWDSQKTDKLETVPTSKEAGEIVKQVMIDNILKVGYRMNAETKERFLFWLKMPEGRVWLSFYETDSEVRTKDYNLTLLS